MPNINDLRKSRFLTKADVGKGMLVTIRSVEEMNVAKEGAPEELRWCLTFEELEKPLVLNSTNGQLIAAITGSEELNDAIGTQVVLYDDPTIMFAGKLTGGIRVRAPKTQPSPKTTRQTPPPDNSIPF